VVAACAALALFAANSRPAAAQSTVESCPGSTTLMATFSFSGGQWQAAADPAGIVVSGDAAMANWTSAARITAVVITAGSVTENFVYDPLETAGTIAANDVKEAAGGALSAIGFCQGNGAVPAPSSGSGISVGVTKTASCAELAPDGSLTVSGEITVVRHSPTGDHPHVAFVVRVARDTVYGAGDVMLHQFSVEGLAGATIGSDMTSMTVPYTVTFEPGNASDFTNKIEVVVEEAGSGLLRHKYNSDRAAFGVCAGATATPTPTPTPTPTATPTPTPTPTPEGSVGGSTGTPAPTPEQSVQAGTGTPAPVPNTAIGKPGSGGPVLPFLALLLLSLAGGLVYLTGERRRG
jgi:hypothetical protein